MRLDLSAEAEAALNQLLEHCEHEQSPAEVVEQALLHYRECQALPLLIAPKVEFTDELNAWGRLWDEAMRRYPITAFGPLPGADVTSEEQEWETLGNAVGMSGDQLRTIVEEAEQTKDGGGS